MEILFARLPNASNYLPEEAKKILEGPGRVICEKLGNANLSEKQCRLNRIEAQKRNKQAPWTLGRLVHCLTCPGPKEREGKMSQLQAQRLANKGKWRVRILTAVDRFLKEKERGPSVREVAELLEENPATVSYHLKRMVREGLLRIDEVASKDFATYNYPEPLAKTTPEEKPARTHPKNPCPKHPNQERKVDKNGVVKGFCETCYREQGAQNLKPGVGSGPGSIFLPLGQPQYQNLLAWLREEAENNLRSLHNQVLFILKQAMKAAKG